MDLNKIKKFLDKKYEFIELIGKGGFAEVHLAKDKILERKVAIKILLPQFSSDSAIIERFIREAKLYAKLEHKNLIPIYDTGLVDDCAFIIMKYIKGDSLSSLLKKKGRLTYQIIAQMIKEIASTLSYIHSGGIIHRDVKPSNILIEEGTNKYYLADFGIARSDSSKTLTKSGLILGTPNYISPEQIKGKSIDHRADIYALGAMSYELVTGKPIFSGETSMEVLYQHVNEEPECLTNYLPDIPKEINFIITKCLEKNPEKRFQNADEITDVFDTKRGTFISRYLKEREARQSKSVKKRILILLLLVIMISGSVFIIKKISEKNDKKEPIITEKIPIVDVKKEDKKPDTEKTKTQENKIIVTKAEKPKTEPKKTGTEKVTEKRKEMQPEQVKRKPLIKPKRTEKKPESSSIKESTVMPKTGTVRFSSSVPADVYLNEKKIGDTHQFFQEEYKPGKYTFKFVIQDYQTFTREVTVSPGKTIQVHQKFDPYGIITIIARPYAKLYIDGMFLDEKEVIRKKKLPVGKHTIKAVKEGYVTQEQSVTIEKRKSIKVNFNLKKEEKKNE